jgi:hypothetical protein
MSNWYKKLQEALALIESDHDLPLKNVSVLESTFLLGSENGQEFAVDINTAYLYYIEDDHVKAPVQTNVPSAYDEFRKTNVLPRFAHSCVNAKIENFKFTVTQTLFQRPDHDEG